MKHLIYNYSNLDKLFVPKDFLFVSKKQHKFYKDIIIREALNIIFDNKYLNLAFHKHRGKFLVSSRDDSLKLLYRKVCRNLRDSGFFSNRSRNVIINNIINLLNNNKKFRVYRLDIKDFYESFSLDFIISNIKNKTDSYSESLIVKTIESCNRDNRCIGLPRGISFSGVLADIFMSNFDSILREHHEVFYYDRFVDDIIIITSSREAESEFMRLLECSLPEGLKFNDSKRKIVISDSDRIDYLGYQLSFNKNGVSMDLSVKKRKKIKRRIARSFIDYVKNKDEELLLDRLKFITGNYFVFGRDMRKIKSGLKYTYNLVSEETLSELDSYLRFILISNNGRLNLFIKKHLDRKLIKYIVNYFSFKRFYKYGKFFYFSPVRMKKIKECWINE